MAPSAHGSARSEDLEKKVGNNVENTQPIIERDRHNHVVQGIPKFHENIKNHGIAPSFRLLHHAVQ